MNQKIKIIVPSKNTFQNMGALKNCSLKKCVSKLLFLKDMHNKKIFTDEHEKEIFFFIKCAKI